MERTAGEDGAVTPKQVNREGAVTVVTQTHMEGGETSWPTRGWRISNYNVASPAGLYLWRT